MQQIVFIHNLSPNHWVIVFLALSNTDSSNTTHQAEVFFNEESDCKQLDSILEKLSNRLSAFFNNSMFTFQERMEIPAEFEADLFLLAFVLAVTLHQNGKYLLINHDIILKHMFEAISDFQEIHDQWLGKFDLHRANYINYPFILDQEYPEKLPKNKRYIDNLDNLKTLGWKVLDVEGDGHCGYYATLLGLENLGNMA